MSGVSKPVRGLFVPQHLLDARNGGAPRSGALVTPRADPIPSPEVERKLRDENARWFLKYLPYPKPHWAVCEWWRDNDPRRQLVQNGTLPIGAAFDMVAHCPLELSADDAVAHVLRHIRRVTDPAKQAEAEVAALEKSRADHRQAIKDELRAEIEHQASRMTSHDANLLAGATTAHPMVPGADLTKATP